MKRVLPTVVLALVCGLLGWYVRGPRGGAPSAGSSTDRTGPPASAQHSGEAVVALGRIEPSRGVIDVAGTVGDRLAVLRVAEGDLVDKGQPLAELESRALRKLELDAATGQLQNAEGRLAVENQLADLKIEAARLGLKKAEAAALGLAAQQKKVDLLKVSLALAKKDQQRLSGLSKELVTDQERERQALLVQQAGCELESARAMMDQFACTSGLGIEAARLDLAAAEAAKKQLPFAIPVESLRTNRRLAAAQFDRTQITAPCSGTILKTFVRPGETIGGKPILQIADLRRMVVVAEVYENEIKHVHPDRPAFVSSKALPPPSDKNGFQGKVTRIGRMINAPALKGVDPFAPADRHVVEVRVELDDDGSRQAAALSNLQVDVRFPKER
jgi:HlyD family secretion protein